MKSEESAMTFQRGYNCAQGVLLPFAEENGLSRETASLIASSFGAGMGKTQETCGALTGALMALGLKHGFARPDDQARRDLVLQRTKELIARFREEFGTTKCRDLLNCDLNTDEGAKLHKDQDQRNLVCAKCVRYAASLVESL